MIKKILLFFLFWKIFTILGAYFGSFLLPNISTFESGKFAVGLPFWLKIWGNFDGYHYMEIAQRGYQNLEQGFFPLFPLIINLISTLFKIPPLVSGQLISNAAFALSLFVICKLLIRDKNEKIINLIILIIIFFPTSFFYGAVYNDSLFFLLATLAIYFSRNTKWIHSSIFACLATLTRLNGLALFFFIIIEYINSNLKNLKLEWDFKSFAIRLKKYLSFSELKKSKLYFTLLIPLSFIFYLFYINIIFKSWQTLFSSMKVWGQDKAVFPLIVFWRYFKIVALHPTFLINYWVAVFELLMVIFYIFLICYSFKKIRLSYWALFALSILIPSLTGTFQGMPRYGLHLFPMYLSIALLLNKSNYFVKFLYFAFSIIFLIFALTLFTRGYFVA